MAAKQFIRPEIIFVFIRVHSWLKTFRPSGSRATKSVGIRKIKRNHVGAGFPRPIASITDPGGENPPLRWIAWLRLIFKDHQRQRRHPSHIASRLEKTWTV